MAEVFLSRMAGPQGFERLVALKKVRPRFTEDTRFVERLVSEARIMVRLSHGNICQVLDFGVMDGQYFLAMEYVSGCDLSVLLHGLAMSHEAFPPVVAAWIATEVARGLDYAHRRTDESGRPLGVVHRDVTPENVLISHDGEVKLTDFGIAQARGLGTPAEVEGVVVGKAAYLAPELLTGSPGDARSDVFSSGILLWEMLVGRPLFRRAAESDTIDAVLRQPIVPPSRLRPEVPPELDAITIKALARKPAQRHGSAAALLEDLSRFIAATAPGMTGAPLAELVARLAPRTITTDEALQTTEVTVPHEVVSLATTDTPSPRRAVSGRVPVPPMPAPSLDDAQAHGTADAIAVRPSTMPFEPPPRARTRPIVAIGAALAFVLVAAIGTAVALHEPTPPLRAVPIAGGPAPAPDTLAPPQPTPPVVPVPTPPEPPVAPAQPTEVPVAPPEPPRPPNSRTGHRETPHGPGEGGEQRPPVTPPPSAGGFINVNARPWGKVYVDGRLMADETPARLPVGPGPHVVKVYFVTAARYSPARQVAVEPGQTRGMFFELQETP